MILPVSYTWCTIEETKIQPAMTILIAVLIIFKGNYNAHIKIKQKKAFFHTLKQNVVQG